MTLNCIAVDDEPLALGLVCKFIEQTPFFNLVGRYASAVEALKAIHSQKIHLVYLDIQMPDLNGIELARVIGKGLETPRIIFTTAFEHYSLEGYKVDALDYLLKPFNYEEFLRTATKAHSYYELINRAVPATVVVESEHADDQYLFLKVEYQLVRIALDDILYIEGLKDYVKVHLKNTEKAVLSLTSLKALEEKLSPRKFMRVHRSYIVALDKISSMTKNSLQIGKKSIAVGDQYKDAFNQFVKKWI
jgi:DNA-binding LytR/AlgR family response regulator